MPDQARFWPLSDVYAREPVDANTDTFNDVVDHIHNKKLRNHQKTNSLIATNECSIEHIISTFDLLSKRTFSETHVVKAQSLPPLRMATINVVSER